MERIPKFLDNLDSAAYALRILLLGYSGRALLGALLLLGVALASGLSPVFRVLALSTIGSFMLTDILYLAASRPKMLRKRDSRH